MESVRESTIGTLLEIIDRLEDADDDEIQCWANAVDFMLDDLGGEDFFGTERQCDPRGDQRNGDFQCGAGVTEPNPSK